MSSLVLTTVTRLVSPTVWLFSIWLLASGHNAPGGGFIGGLVAGAALVLAYAAGGVEQVRRVMPVSGPLLLASGLGLAQVTAVAAIALGGEILQSTILDLRLPVFGEVHVPTPFFFDLGVYLVVLGLVKTALATLGRTAAAGAATQGREVGE